MTNTDFAYGFARPEDTATEFNVLQFAITQRLAQVRTIVWVQVKAVHGGGTGAGPPTVDVQPLASLVDGQGNATPHGIITGIPVLRYGPFIADPAPNDIGLLAVADRDVSSFKRQGNSAKPGPPATPRTFRLADGTYLGTLFGAAPTRYAVLDASGVRIVDGLGNTITTTSTGLDLKDSHGNEIKTAATGITITDANGNQMQMKVGAVNFVTGALQVNGVPVTVP